LERESTDMQRAIDEAAGRLQRELDMATSDERAYRRQLEQLQSRSEELTKLQQESAALQPQIAELEPTGVELRRGEQRRTELNTENERLKRDMHEIKDKLAALAGGHGSCPICRRALDEGDHAHIADLWEADGTLLGDRFRANRDEVKALDQQIAERATRIGELERLRDDEARRAGHIHMIERELAAGAELERSAAEAAGQAALLTATLHEQRFAETERAALASAAAALLALPYERAQHEEADTHAAELAHFDAEHKQLETARQLAATLSEVIATAERQCVGLRAEIDRQAAQIANYEKQLTGAEATRRRHVELTATLREQEQQNAACQARVGSLQQQLAQLDELAEERRSLTQQVAEVALDADALKELAGAFGRNGIQALIIDTVLPELSDEANTLLRRMSTGAMQVEMHTQRELQTRDAVAETLDIIIRDEHGVRPYDLYSGGEAFRINFAIRVALAKLLARRAGATIDMLVIDEGFGTQDSQGRDGIVEALQSVADDFASIIVITHIDELRDLFTTRIEVVKTAEGSRVSVS
jgi:exonuclease SbcC